MTGNLQVMMLVSKWISVTKTLIKLFRNRYKDFEQKKHKNIQNSRTFCSILVITLKYK